MQSQTDELQPAGQSEKQKIARQIVELQELSTELRTKFDGAGASHKRLLAQSRFLSRDRKHFWRMPRWLWVPIVVALCGLLVAAMLQVSQGGEPKIMFKKILNANRSGQPQSGAAAHLHRLMHEVHAGDFTRMERAYV